VSGAQRIRILHISDLHARGARDQRRAWKRTQVLGDAWRRNLDELTADGHGFELVAFTGDVADWGLPEDYAEATSFVDELLTYLKVPRERFFAVPGNHDIQRKLRKSAWRKMREGMWSTRQQVGEWLADAGKVPFGFQPKWRDAVLDREQAFWNWIERDLGRSDLLPKNSPHGRLGYRVSISVGTQPVHIIGLDSAWLAGDNSDAGKLWLTEDQLGRLCRDDRGQALPGFRLALVHHPLSDLADANIAVRHLSETVDLVLRGHQHTPVTRTLQDPDRSLRELAAGCLYEGDLSNRYPNAFQVIDAVLDTDGRPLRYDIRFRAWSPNGHWYDDGALYREARQGRFTWHVAPVQLPTAASALLAGPRLSPPPTDVAPTFGRLWEVPELPPHYLVRLAHLEQLERSLLAPAASAVGITAVSQSSSPGADKHGLYGMGGIGKSVLAAAIARQQVIRERFHDGIFWITLGQIPQITVLQAQLGRALGHAEVFDSISEGTQQLREHAADRAILVILDDVWNATHAQALDVVGRSGRILVTTRDLEVLTWLDAREYYLDVLDPAQALALLADWTQVAKDTLPPAAADVARSCGYLPLALAMIGALVRRGRTWAEVQTWLDEAQLVRIQGKVPAYPYRNVIQAVEASVIALAAEHELGRQCYIDLAVFPEDTPIPRAALQLLWARHGLQPADVDALADTLSDRALARRAGGDRVVLHDLQRLYARSQVEDPAALHSAFVDAYLARRDRAVADRDGPYAGLDPYLFLRLPWHLAEAGRYDELTELLFDFDWLDAKLRATNVTALVGDFVLLPRGHEYFPDATLLCGALKLSSHVLKDDADQLPSQLLARMLHLAPVSHGFSAESWIGRFLERLRSFEGRPWLRSRISGLTPPGRGLLRTLCGHAGVVWDIAISADGSRGISGGDDCTVRVWDLERGQELAALAGHTRRISAVAITEDGSIGVSGALDGMVTVWDIKCARQAASWSGHNGRVNAVAVSADGRRVISGGDDGTVMVWDLESGLRVASLSEHTGLVSAVALNAFGSLGISGGSDGLVNAWDLIGMRQLASLSGHVGWVRAVALSADGKRATSGADDGTIKVWDVACQRELITLAGHEKVVRSVAMSANGRRAVSVALEEAIKVWDLENHRQIVTLTGHETNVREVAMSADGKRVISASDSGDIKVWDLSVSQYDGSVPAHLGHVNTVAVSADGKRVVSGANDGTIRVWDTESGQQVAVFTGGTTDIWGVAVTPNGSCAVSGSDDGTVKVWDLRRNEQLACLSEHPGLLYALAVSADGLRAVSGAWDGTMKVWDLRRGEEVAPLRGHDCAVMALTMSPDGKQAVSSDVDGILNVWDLDRCQQILSIEGRAGWVRSVAIGASGIHAISADAHAIEILDLNSSLRVARLPALTKLRAVAIDASGKRAVLGGNDGAVKVFCLTRNEPYATFTVEGAIQCCAISPDGRFVVAGDASGRVHILELVTPK
jgi:WD40 repeat protein